MYKSKMKILSQVNPDNIGKYRNKDEAEHDLEASLDRLYALLYLMYAENQRALLIILHGIDTSGKDGTIRHLFRGANPQGIQVFSFKKPTEEELRHDYLWRCHRHTPETGYVTIFNRSYYEEVSTLKVHPEYLKARPLLKQIHRDADLFKKRYQQINDFERMLTENGTTVMKFFLHISKAEQKKRLVERLKDPTKNWKFSVDDIQERKRWGAYMKAYDQMLVKTHTKHAPWHVIPANEKWYRNLKISEILVETLEGFKMKYPKLESKKILSQLD